MDYREMTSTCFTLLEIACVSHITCRFGDFLHFFLTFHLNASNVST